MSTTIAIYDTEDYFSDTHGNIDGEAHVDVQSVSTVDGTVYHLELICVKIGALNISYGQMCDAFTASMVEGFLDKLAETMIAEAA